MTGEPLAPRPGEPTDLPPILATIAAAAGEPVALTIAAAYGGTRVTIPAAAGKNWLTGLVGADAAAAIIEAIGPTRRLDVPLGPEGGYAGRSRRQLHAQLAEMDAAGYPDSRIARTLGIPDRRVRRWRAAQRDRLAQGDLFDQER